jgi:hypothetical protein
MVVESFSPENFFKERRLVYRHKKAEIQTLSKNENLVLPIFLRRKKI